MIIRDLIKDLTALNKRQLTLYLLGCVIFSLGAKCFIDSDLGVDPLDVQILGLSHHLHLTIGLTSGLVAVSFLTVWSLWNHRPPLLTPFLTTFICGNLIDLWILIRLERISQTLFRPVALLIFGLILCAYASSLIIMSGIGIRIMDLIAITIVKKRRWPFFAAKLILEIYLCVSGWLLGGPVGIGTIAFIVLVGTLIQPFMLVNERLLKMPNCGLAEEQVQTAAA
jgi:uncharacterized protein